MKHQRHAYVFLCVVMLFSITDCQFVSRPSPAVMPTTSAVPQPTRTSLEISVTPTGTEIPTAIQISTLIPESTCGNIVVPQITSQLTDESKVTGKFEPPDNQVYFGFLYRIYDYVIAGDERLFRERICDAVKFELSGKTPTFMVVGIPWGTRFSFLLEDDAHKIETSLGSSVTLVVDWDANFVFTTEDIAAGKSDDYIVQFARDVKEYDKPLFIKLLCDGFNGNWNTACSPKANSDLTSHDFIDAYRRVVDIFREENVTNVAWIWEPAAPVPPEIGNWGWDPWWVYYPGDEYVDWIGVLQPGWGTPDWLSPLNLFGVDHHKPLIVEFAIRHAATTRSHAQWVNWLTAMFDYIESHPQIKAITYLNVNGRSVSNSDPKNLVFLYDRQVNYVPDVNDMDQRLIAGGEDIRTLFSNRIANPRYISVLATPTP